MPYKLIATDFDGSLLNDQKEISNRTISTLKECKKCGYYIVGVSARAIESAKSVVPFELFDYLLLNNGAYLYDTSKKEGTYLGNLSKSLALSILNTMEKHSTQIDFISGNKYYIYKKNTYLEKPFIENIQSLDEIKEEIVRMNIFLKDQNDIFFHHQVIQKKYPEILCFVMQDSTSSKMWLVINPKDLNKANSLKKLGKKLNISPEEMIFFGDGLNDLEVIKEVGLGVALGNALPAVKECAKEITLTNNEDGIALFLEKKLLKK